jgi:UbiD family decarboxylase
MARLPSFIREIDRKGKLARIKKPVSTYLEIAGIMKALGDRPVLFERVKGSRFRVAGNLFSTRKGVADSLGIKEGQLLRKIQDAIDNPKKPTLSKSADFIETDADLRKLPMLFHYPKDGGPFITSGVVIAHDKQYGRNCSFHRMMVIGKDRFSMRIVPRHLHKFIERARGELEVAVCIGCPINVLLAGATSVGLGVDELGIANALKRIETVRLDSGIEVPAESEFVIEGRITREMADEGPFVDITGTYDIVRKQPVMEVDRILHKRDAVYHALLPGEMEHKLLMGMPREPTIFREVGRECECKGVHITPGGCSWLHAVVGIKKRKEDDGKKAINAAFRGHGSLKHVVVVDDDIDIYDLRSVEWAIATRLQADKGVVTRKEPGSSLDPSADLETRMTCKMGIDATKPLGRRIKKFEKAIGLKVDLKKYLER